MKKTMRALGCLFLVCLMTALMVASVMAEGKPVTAAELKAIYVNAGYQVDDDHGVTDPGVVFGFRRYEPTEEGTWLIPIVEFENEAFAQAYAKKMRESGIATVLASKIVITISEYPDIPKDAGL